MAQALARLGSASRGGVPRPDSRPGGRGRGGHPPGASRSRRHHAADRDQGPAGRRAGSTILVERRARGRRSNAGSRGRRAARRHGPQAQCGGPGTGGRRRRILREGHPHRRAPADEHPAHLRLRRRPREARLHPRRRLRRLGGAHQRHPAAAAQGRLHQCPLVHLHRPRGRQRRPQRAARRQGGRGVPGAPGALLDERPGPGRRGAARHDQGPGQPRGETPRLPDRRRPRRRVDPRVGRRDERRREALHARGRDPRLPDTLRDLQAGRRVDVHGADLQRAHQGRAQVPVPPQGARL